MVAKARVLLFKLIPKRNPKTTYYHSIVEFLNDTDIPRFSINDVNSSECINLLKYKLKPDICIIVSLGQILKKEILSVPRFGFLNLGIALGEKVEYRGPSGSFWSLYYGDTKTAVIISKVDEGIDTGDIVCERFMDVQEDDTEDSLTERGAYIGAESFVEVIEKLEKGQLKPIRTNMGKTGYYTYPTAEQRNELKRRLKIKHSNGKE
ncbi:formyltransferase family protein [Candidatus Altiarchaeota archaeon]